MVAFVLLFDSAQNGDGRFGVGLFDQNFLKTALQRFVFFEVLLELVKGCRTHAAKLAAGECGLQDVGCVHGAFAAAGSNQGVDFVDEQNEVALGGSHLLNYGLEALFEFPFVLGSGDERAHVE